MSLVYEQLYQSENLAQVDMEPYLHHLTVNVLQAFGGNRDVDLSVEAAGVSLDVETAMPCGLIVNELLTNALKHAFPPEFAGPGHVQVRLQAEGEACTLQVSDDGVGLPPGLDWHQTESLGLKLVNLWATHQLGGRLEVETRPGTTFQVTFVERTERNDIHG
jgi:two-component sensor histidine kinase